MKRSLRSVSLLLTGVILLGGCTAAPTAFEPQHKTETEVTNITDGMIPQVIERNVIMFKMSVTASGLRSHQR